MTSGEILKLLTDSGDDEAVLDARILCEELEGEALSLAAERRAKGEPLAYILGHRHFWREDYKVISGVLIPRADTELLVECALRFCGCHELATGDVLDIPVSDVPKNVRFADICTGTGCVGISLANELARHGFEVQGILTDISDTALEVASCNLKDLSKGGLEVLRNDIARDDYTFPTVLYDVEHKDSSLLHRIMEKARHYTVIHVDSTIADIQRTFTFDDISILSLIRNPGCIPILTANPSAT